MTSNNRFASPGWKVFLAGGLAVAAAFVMTAGKPVVQAYLYLGLSAAQSAAVVITVARRRPYCRGAWWVLSVGVVLFSLGNALWYGYPVILGGALPFPSPADVLFFAAYTCVAAALVLFIRSRATRGDRVGALVDSAIITVAAAVIAWVYLLGPTAALSAASSQERAVALGYPLFDLALLALAVRLVFTRGHRSPAFWCVTAFVSAQLLSDAAYSLAVLRGTFAYGRPLTVGWLVSYAFVGAAALHPSMRTLGVQTASPRVPLAPMLRLLVVGAAALVVPVMSQLDHDGASHRLYMRSAAVLFVLASVRMIVLVRQLQTTVERLNESEDDLAYQAHHEALTGLPNRAYFTDRLARAVATRHAPLTVMLLDLDGFKTVNDSLGHAAGDAMLVAVADRLTGGLRGSDIVARLGGDEFTVLAEGVDATGAADLAGRVLASLDAPIVINGRQVFCQASIGIAVGCEGSHSEADLLRDADAAMYSAKRRGGRRYELFTVDMRAGLLDRLTLETDLRKVVLGREMVLHYQPLVDLANGEIVGFEALLRWNHPERGMVSPCDFIPIAEETGAIIPIGKWVIDEACRQVCDWQAGHPRTVPYGINVNVSARQLADPGLVDDVARALAQSGLDPALLTLEITETMIMADEDEARECLVRLKGLGVRISVDDFGTGYSSLGHLDRFPVDELKIDRSFVASLGSQAKGSGVAAATIRLARSLHLDVVAEGIEREDQLIELRRSACARGQGYFFSKPLDPKAMEALLTVATRSPMPPTPTLVALVVDDDRSTRNSTCRILRRAGFETIAAATGGEAIACVKATSVDLVVLDVGLPDMDGYTVCRSLSAGRNAAVRVIYLSGSAIESCDRVRGLDAGADLYLTKPAAPDELVAAARAVLRGREVGLFGNAATMVTADADLTGISSQQGRRTLLPVGHGTEETA